jgi:Cu-Zn family superoxide dismutase
MPLWIGVFFLFFLFPLSSRGDEKALAVVHGFSMPITGEIYFEKTENGISVTGTVWGLQAGKTLGFHIHQLGDCRTPLSSGPHFDPEKTEHHGSPTEPAGSHHGGDLPNLVVDSQGVARIRWLATAFSFYGKKGILGRAVIIHEKEDDYKTQPAGGAGGRIACGIVGVLSE